MDGRDYAFNQGLFNELSDTTYLSPSGDHNPSYQRLEGPQERVPASDDQALLALTPYIQLTKP
jgi:hypothetical protein